ncbi:VCBS repeat-containing protein [Streptomyces sp. NBC_00572]|uniref:FG-GAP repeat domain-containing protein n=1 Tax=Streptomyces sp. NBC_00572 TaxID=2903664 RepID=UPI002251E519|nr:VCBS repeat-containing protein [Streptomyces sp. NBC_00572]MCX4985982.1 VCBS repeat-containing protein [Streptomyces sp. NBC_00572]
MLLASPAIAESAPRPVLELPLTETSVVPTLDVSALDGMARTAEATAGSKPRFDVTGDGKTDLIHRTRNGFTFVAPSSGGEHVEFTTAGSFLDLDLVPLGDQNGTGKPEVLSLSANGALRLYSDASTTTGTPSWTGYGWNIYNKVFSPGDVDGDGRADVMARQYNGDLYFYRSTGTVTAPFAGRVKVGPGWGAYDQLVGLGDNDGDGKGDLLARTPSGQVYFYGSTGNKSAPFKPRRALATGWQVYNQVIAVDDRNLDGHADVFARDLNGTLWAYYGRGNGTFTSRAQTGSAWNRAEQFGGAGNVPSVGKTLFIARDKAGTLFWHRGLNNGKLAAREQVSDTGGYAGANLSLVYSLDGGTLPDLLGVYKGRLWNNGKDLGAGWQVYNRLVGPGDLTGDGKSDLLARDTSGVLYLYRGNGTGTGFASRIRVGDGWSAYNQILGAGDYTGDGRADVLARDGSGKLFLYRGTGSATAPFAGRLNIGGGWGSYTKLVAPGDLSGDGRADLLAVDAAGDLYRYLGTGTGSAISSRVKIGYGYQAYGNLY